MEAIVSPIAPEVWIRLEEARPTGDGLIARLGLPSVTDRLMCAVDARGGRHLLIVLQPDEDELRDLQSRGLSVLTRELVVQGQPSARYMEVECHDATGYPALDVIGAEIADGLLTSGRQPAEIVKHVLAKWRRFWGQLPRRTLSREEQLGLFAELWFLSAWLLPRLGSTALVAWRGPLGSRHDFEWPDKSVEVKGTTSTRGRIHQIHGLDQLMAPENGPLYLFSLHLCEEAGAGNCLPRVIETCRHQLASDGEALGRIESILLQAGYSPIYEEEYSKLRLRIIEEVLFVVSEGFPHLSNLSFVGGIPPGIERVEYEINLNTFDHLIVARQPDQWSF